MGSANIATGFCNISILKDIPMLNGSNFESWKENLMLVLGLMDLDLALRAEAPVVSKEITPDEKNEKEKWERSNRLSLMIMKRSIPEKFRGAFSDKIETAKGYLEDVEKKFARIKNYAVRSILFENLVLVNYKGGSIREYILEKCSIASKLRTLLNNEISDNTLFHFVLNSLPAQFEQFKENYLHNTKETWSLNELISHCVNEEERLKHYQNEGSFVGATSESNDYKKRKIYIIDKR